MVSQQTMHFSWNFLICQYFCYPSVCRLSKKNRGLYGKSASILFLFYLFMYYRLLKSILQTFMSLNQWMFVVNHISTFLVMWLPVTSVLLDSIRLTYCFYHISFKIFSKKCRCPYVVSIIYSELYWCLWRTHEYTISSLTKCCHLNGYDFIKHCLLISFDMFVNINKYLYILSIFACYLFYCLVFVVGH